MPDLADIQRAVATSYGIGYAEMFGQSRNRAVARPRQVAMYLARELTSLTTTRIGNHFGRDHTTVMHAIWKVGELAAGNVDNLADRLDTLRQELAPKDSFRKVVAAEVAAAQALELMARNYAAVRIVDELAARRAARELEHIPPRIVFDTNVILVAHGTRH
jgi:hypothetical protein